MKALYLDEIPEIRLVPFSRKGFRSRTIEEIQEDFRNDSEVWYTKNILAPKNTLLLFRTEGLVFASALLDGVEKQTDEKYPYHIFYRDYIAFNPPIELSELTAIDKGFGKGTRSVRILDIRFRNEILNLLTASQMQSLPEQENQQSFALTKTEFEQVVKSRIGQTQFRSELLHRDKSCKICGLNISELLYASHIKPWKDCDNEERLDPNNGFLLCSIHNDLFDKRLISFKDNGRIIISNTITQSDYSSLGIDSETKIEVLSKQRKYLIWHRQMFDKK